MATELFFKHGFEAVTVDEIAIAAKVSKMTVFNYFARKEELILDREDDLMLLPFRQALCNRPKDQSPVDALRTLVLEMSHQKHPLCHINNQMVSWWRVIDASPTLKARVREVADEASEGLAIELGGPEPDGPARLAAGMIVLTVRTAREEAIRLIEHGASVKKANAAFLTLIEQGLSAVKQLPSIEAARKTTTSLHQS
ncbi:helix-turn-helix domain containing protein [Caballeronia sp. LP003]|uniref:TetR/AcrR family transcriptional regulator n=1 Tax=Caballeronia sp. LP003 TaxID=3038551 RepID=UPI00285CEC3A|nr:helix-turn-helix domain-containing protein [Caballeronia sp. LP003]MDR5785288.1 helix-turn-helix domain containing protein [Caballeronia sp. LP003]